MKKKSLPWKQILSGIVIIAVVLVGANLFFPDFVAQFSPSVSNNHLIATRSMSKGSDGFFAMEMEAMDFDEGGVAGFASPESSIVPPQPGGGIEVEAPVRHLIQTGNLSLIVEDVEDSVQKIRMATEEDWNGFVAESSLSDLSEGARSGWMRLRVPAEEFSPYVEYVKGIAERVESENIRVDDVTAQVVDTEARLTNMREEEEQYRAILKTARTVEETLEVTRELTRVRGQIERTEAQLKNVKEEVAFSTLHLNLVDQGDVEVFGIYWKPLVNAKQALRGALENLTGAFDALVVFVFNIPLLLFWLVILGLVGKYGWKGLRWSWQKMRQ